MGPAAGIFLAAITLDEGNSPINHVADAFAAKSHQSPPLAKKLAKKKEVS